MSGFATTLGFGLVTGAIIALAAVGLSLQFGVTSVPNFAHGELLTFGAYGALVAQFVTHNVLVDVLIGMLSAGAVAWAMNRFVLQSFIRIGTRRIYLLIVTAGLSLFLQNALAFVFGERDQFLQLPSNASFGYNVGPFIWTQIDLGVILSAVISIGPLHLLLQYTKFGKAQRAVSDSAELARVSGIPVTRVVNITWLIVGLLAGLAGIAIASTSGSMTPTLGSSFLLIVFAAAIVGGIGRPYGALVAAVILGIAMEVSAAYVNASYKQVIAIAVLILAVLFRPTGLFSTARAIE